LIFSTDILGRHNASHTEAPAFPNMQTSKDYS